jgi:pimeloyl-ACP methyl ester carboxylesterase
MVSRSSAESPAPRTHRRCSCCTACRRRPGCSSRSSRPLRSLSPRRTGLSGIRTHDWPDAKQFAYTFDRLAEVMQHFTEAVGLSRYTLYMQDYGGPVGFRMALAHPERVEALIVQDAVAHNEGLGANWKTRRAFWADRAANGGRTPHEPPLAGHDPDAPCRERSQRRTPRPGPLDG